MSIVDYSSLQTAVIAWLNRAGDADATSQVTTWIQLAEGEILAKLKTSPLDASETVNSNYTISSEYTALPAGFAKARELRLSDGTQITFVAPTSIDANACESTTADEPQYGVIQGNQLRVIPPPDSTYTGIFTYEGLTPLSVSNTTNWLVTNHPNIYLFATLAQADRYYRDAEGYVSDSTVWSNLFDKLYAGSGLAASGSPLQIRVNGSTP